MELGAFLEGERASVEAALERALEKLLPLLPTSLHGPVEHGISGGGKRLRPILFATAYRACDGPSGNSAAIYDLAVAIELIHGYSLMHDDLPCMDDAQLRRGSPTPHTLFGEPATVIGGAALIPAAGLQVWRAGEALGLERARREELIGVLAHAAGAAGMVGGQGLDLLGEGQALTREALDGLHRRKTGALLTASLVLGGMAAGASAARRDALRRYGEEVGLAFQIADDVLDATADAQRIGKNPSDDTLEKSTYVRLLGVEGARGEAERRVLAAIDALAAGEIRSPELEALARYVVSRDR